MMTSQKYRRQYLANCSNLIQNMKQSLNSKIKSPIKILILTTAFLAKENMVLQTIIILKLVKIHLHSSSKTSTIVK
jgi:hypothetical protein